MGSSPSGLAEAAGALPSQGEAAVASATHSSSAASDPPPSMPWGNSVSRQDSMALAERTAIYSAVEEPRNEAV